MRNNYKDDSQKYFEINDLGKKILETYCAQPLEEVTPPPNPPPLSIKEKELSDDPNKINGSERKSKSKEKKSENKRRHDDKSMVEVDDNASKKFKR
jgi:hypothetical protein